jgi:hypothetical protein
MFHPVNPNLPIPSAYGAPMGPKTAVGLPGSGAQQADGTDPSQPMVQLSGGKGGGCLTCVGIKSGLVPVEKLEQLKAESYAKVMAHEQAHASAAGAFGGGIHIEYDSDGMAVGGHVPIIIPGLNPDDPEAGLQAYQMIMDAALAPGADASGQDLAVAAQAAGLLGKAQVMMQNKRMTLAQQSQAGMMTSPTNGGKGDENLPVGAPGVNAVYPGRYPPNNTGAGPA